ncbi:hypothetical protein H3V53_21780 [Paraburkholderia bengalensis]|uniref:Uncharacterized protein n=1 Tax=Paraburkholderia bengalensis TaxID=2747562 RepID=A0ABU8IW20_9BURK
MNPIIERDILHVTQVMRASLCQCEQTLDVDYWRRRLTVLLDLDSLTESQRYSVEGLLHEIDEFEQETHSTHAAALPLAG